MIQPMDDEVNLDESYTLSDFYTIMDGDNLHIEDQMKNKPVTSGMDAYARYTGDSAHFRVNKNPAFGKTGSTLLLSGASIVGENGQISV